MAGAQSVVHTLWPVEDASGPDLMVEYYRELKRGKSKSGALTRAKQQYLASTPPSYTHPYYWAAYQITGNPDPLSNPWKFVVFSQGIEHPFCTSHRRRPVEKEVPWLFQHRLF